MKLLLNNNYHLLFIPKPITFMTTFKLHKSLLKLVLCGCAFDKQGNWETEQTSWQQIQDLDLSVSAFKAMFMPVVLSLIPLSFTYGDRDLPANSTPLDGAHLRELLPQN